MKKIAKTPRLHVQKETVRTLANAQLGQAHGGMSTFLCHTEAVCISQGGLCTLSRLC